MPPDALTRRAALRLLGAAGLSSIGVGLLGVATSACGPKCTTRRPLDCLAWSILIAIFSLFATSSTFLYFSATSVPPCVRCAR